MLGQLGAVDRVDAVVQRHDKSDRPVDAAVAHGGAVGSRVVVAGTGYSAATNKQFITVQTRKGETYYLVIDYDKPIDEEAEIYETYFLNLVDDRDLLSVLSEDEIPAPTPTPVVIYATPEPTAVPPMQPTQPDDSADKMMALFALMMIALVGGGALWFFKFRDGGKKNGKLDEDYEFEEDEEEYDEDM